jgi:hypothetical protein
MGVVTTPIGGAMVTMIGMGTITTIIGNTTTGTEEIIVGARFFSASQSAPDFVLQLDGREEPAELVRAFAKELEAVSTSPPAVWNENDVAPPAAIPIVESDFATFSVPVIRKKGSKRQMRPRARTCRRRTNPQPA